MFLAKSQSRKEMPQQGHEGRKKCMFLAKCAKIAKENLETPSLTLNKGIELRYPRCLPDLAHLARKFLLWVPHAVEFSHDVSRLRLRLLFDYHFCARWETLGSGILSADTMWRGARVSRW